MWSRIVEFARRLVRTEPVRLGQLVGALVVLGTFVGADLNAEQLLGVIIAVQTILALVLREAVVSPATHDTKTDVAFNAGLSAGYQSAATDGRFTADPPPVA
jgi:hypothetical protein